MPQEPNTCEPKDELTPVGWLCYQRTRPLSLDHGDDCRFEFVLEDAPPSANKLSGAEIGKAIRKRQRKKTSLSTKTDRSVTDCSIFSLRLKPTTKQKLLFQQAFSIARLAKRETYRLIGPHQHEGISTDRMLELKKLVTSEHIHQMKRIDVDDPKNKRRKVTTKLVNTTLAPYTRRILYEQNLPRQGRLPNDVRKNAVISFCRAINSTKAATEEKQAEWDHQLPAYERHMMGLEDELLLLKSKEAASKQGKGKGKGKDKDKKTDRYGQKKLFSTSKLFTTKPRPEMKPRQVKPPNRNRPKHSFSIDPKSFNANPFSIRWDKQKCQEEGCVFFMKQKIKLWGCPSKWKRELRRLTSKMENGEQGSRKQVTLKYDNGRYYLMIQCLSPKVQPRQNPKLNCVGLDPGVRTFLATYDNQGRYGDIGAKQIRRVMWEAKKADVVRSRLDKCEGKSSSYGNSRKRKMARREIRRHNLKARDLRADAHWKTARVLCEQYDDIILPKFNSRWAVRVLGRTTTRQLLSWSHFQFRQRLLHKAQQLGARVHLKGEKYSTITCSSCFHIEPTMRKNPTKWFECNRCGYGIDRDWNAARNILIMNVEACMGQVKPVIIDDDDDDY